MILDRYFRSPILWDYILSLALAVVAHVLYNFEVIGIPTKDIINSMSSDISTIAFTSVGFVLTFLTLLISFKSAYSEKKGLPESETPLFQFFLSSGYFGESVRHLKNAIKSLISIALFEYLLKFFLLDSQVQFAHWFNLLSILIISLTLFRCLLIVTKILTLQNKSEGN